MIAHVPGPGPTTIPAFHHGIAAPDRFSANASVFTSSRIRSAPIFCRHDKSDESDSLRIKLVASYHEVVSKTLVRDNTTIKFKLAELLEAVAIIGVLAAISIPIFTTQLEKAREAVDVSNMRAAYAVAQSDVLTEGYKDASKYTAEAGGTYRGYYTVSGDVKASSTDTYGKSTLDGYQTTNDLPKNADFDWDGKETGKKIQIDITPAAGKYVKISWA